MDSLTRWIDAQYRHSARSMLMSVSPLSVIKSRPGFGQCIQTVRGAIVASPVPGAYDPEPDYFFHWYRDAAIVVDALRLLAEDPNSDVDAVTPLPDFVEFSASLAVLDGRTLAASPAWRAATSPAFARYLRTDVELSAVWGAAVSAETRVNADGRLDITRWPRPQHDGPALRALALLRWLRSAAFPAGHRASVAALVEADLEYIVEYGRTSCFDIWEEERGRHYYTLRISAAALAAGAAWYDSPGSTDRGTRLRTVGAGIGAELDEFWSAELGYVRSRLLDDAVPSAKELDIAVILAAIHAGETDPTRPMDRAHSVCDPRLQATLDKLAALFGAEYLINQLRDAGAAPALGRYRGDSYFSGGAYYFATLGAAEFLFRVAWYADDPQTWIAAGDAYLATVRRFTPASGDLAEQFDRTTGAPNSARHLAWSYAAFISCIAARRHACGR